MAQVQVKGTGEGEVSDGVEMERAWG